jgi:hypothetical protein
LELARNRIAIEWDDLIFFCCFAKQFLCDSASQLIHRLRDQSFDQRPLRLLGMPLVLDPHFPSRLADASRLGLEFRIANQFLNLSNRIIPFLILLAEQRPHLEFHIPWSKGAAGLGPLLVAPLLSFTLLAFTLLTVALLAVALLAFTLLTFALLAFLLLAARPL